MSADQLRPLVPAAVQWPGLLEPELLACAPASQGGHLAAIASHGFGAMVPPLVASGGAAGLAASISLQGLSSIGRAAGVTWDDAGLLVVVHTGKVARCSSPTSTSGGAWNCDPLGVPELPLRQGSSSSPVAIVRSTEADIPLRAVLAASGGRLEFFELSQPEGVGGAWQLVGEMTLPWVVTDAGWEDAEGTPEVAAITATESQLLVLANDGVAYHWALREGKLASAVKRDMPATGRNHAWRSSCALADGKIVRLASTWRKAMGGAMAWHPELLF